LHNKVSLENQQLLPIFQSKQTQNSLLQEEYLHSGRFLPKGHPPGSLPSLSETDMLTYRQRGTAQALVLLCSPDTGKSPTALRHGAQAQAFILMQLIPL